MVLARASEKTPEGERTRGQGRPFGDYLPVRRVGVGPLGSVHEAVQLSTGGRVALKRWQTLEPTGAAEPGGRVPWPASELRHRGIVTVHAHGQREDTAWVAMELMPDGSLSRWLEAVARRRTAGRTPPAERWERNVRLAGVFADTAVALEQAHRKGTVHGGIKPENLLFADEGRRLALSDFAPANAVALHAVSWLGEPVDEARHLAPEQRAEAAGPWTDVYALASCLVYALASEGKGLKLRTSGALARSVLGGLEPDIPAALLATLLACLEEDPRARPTAGAFGGALRDAGRSPRRLC